MNVTSGSIPWGEKLSDELWMHILSFVPPLDVLRSATYVSKSLHHMVAPQSYWLFHAKALLQSIHRQHQVEEEYRMQLDTLALNGHQLQRICLVLGASSTSTTDMMMIGDTLPSCLHYGSRLVNRAGAESIRQQNYGTVVSRNNSNSNNTRSPCRGPWSDTIAKEGETAASPIATTTTVTVPTRLHRRRVCLASSTEHPTELLENVLASLGANSADEILQNLGLFALRQHAFQKWWSSRPSFSQESSDTLLFTTNCPLALLSDLKWRPLLDPFTRRQAYTWRHAIVKAYRMPLSKLDPYPEQPNAGYPCTVEALPSGATQHHHSRHRGVYDDDDSTTDSDDEDGQDNEDLSIQSARQEGTALDRVLEGETPIFESPPLPYTLLQPEQLQQQNNRIPTLQRHIPWQHLVFPPGLIANVVTITLVGKDSRQFQNSGYYACVEQVKLDGIPLLKSAQETPYAVSASSGMSVEQHREDREITAEDINRLFG